MDRELTDFGNLPLIGRVAGFLISVATTIYFTWVQKAARPIPHLRQGQKISVSLSAVFLALAWGYWGNSTGLPWLAWSAAIGALACCPAFLAHVWVDSGPVGPDEERRRDLVRLATYMIYTVFGSCGITAAAIFVTVLLANAANAGGLRSEAGERYEIDVAIAGVRRVRERQAVPFRSSSGPVSYGCGEGTVAQAQWVLPEGARIEGPLSAEWQNLANAKSHSARAEVAGSIAIARGTITGLDYQEFGFAGLRNCPGGGHGELVLTGTYVAETGLDRELTVALHGELDSVRRPKVSLTLPAEEDIRPNRFVLTLRGPSESAVVDKMEVETAHLVRAVTSPRGFFAVRKHTEAGRALLEIRLLGS